jgi:hypothetical protein
MATLRAMPWRRTTRLQGRTGGRVRAAPTTWTHRECPVIISPMQSRAIAIEMSRGRRQGRQRRRQDLWPCLPRPGPVRLVGMNRRAEARGGATTATLEARVARLESQVGALIEAVEVLARGFEDAPIAAERSVADEERAARRAHDLLLLVKSAQQTSSGGLPAVGRACAFTQRALCAGTTSSLCARRQFARQGTVTSCGRSLVRSTARPGARRALG